MTLLAALVIFGALGGAFYREWDLAQQFKTLDAECQRLDQEAQAAISRKEFGSASNKFKEATERIEKSQLLKAWDAGAGHPGECPKAAADV